MRLKNNILIEILIPTYNRVKDLKKNILLISEIAVKENLTDHISLKISDNNSNDGTHDIVKKLIKHITFETKLYKQNKNIGLEKNAIFLLSKVKSRYFMFLGDDDFMPKDYMSYIIKKIKGNENLTSIIPAYSLVDAKGNLTKRRIKKFHEKYYKKGFLTTLILSKYGHQMSGVVNLTNNVLNSYLKYKENRNIYPFIYFLATNTERGSVCFCPKYSIKIASYNNKDWEYNEIGLLDEVLKNYRSMYENSPLKQLLCVISLILYQPWRLGKINNLQNIVRSYLNLNKLINIGLISRISFFALYVYLFVRLNLSKIKIKLCH